jgi:hypothetical protein
MAYASLDCARPLHTLRQVSIFPDPKRNKTIFAGTQPAFTYLEAAVFRFQTVRSNRGISCRTFTLILDSGTGWSGR